MSYPVDMADRTDRSVPMALPALLASSEPRISVLQLAKTVGVSASHLSRALRRRDGKSVSPRLASRIAEALGKPADYFPEYRQAVVMRVLREDQAKCDSVYDAMISAA